MKDLKIRRYKPTDNLAVWELHILGLVQNGIPANRNFPPAQDLDEIEKVYLTGGDFLVGEYKGKLIAMGAFKKIDAETAELKRMRVHPDYQGKGFGHTLINKLEKEARKMGYRKMILSTGKTWLKARNLYEKSGYKEVGQKIINERYHAVYYEKELI